MRRSIRVAAPLLAVYCLLLLLALLWPTSTRQSAMVTWLGHVLSGLGAPHRYVEFGRLEVVMNAVIIAPVTLLATFVRPSYSWRDWTALAFCLACLVELAQGLLLPARHAQFSDIVANTLGALLGALLGLGARRLFVGKSSPSRQGHR